MDGPAAQRKNINCITLCSWNINRGLTKKEEEIKYFAQANSIDVLGVLEVDLKGHSRERPFSIEGYQTFCPKTLMKHCKSIS